MGHRGGIKNEKLRRERNVKKIIRFMGEYL